MISRSKVVMAGLVLAMVSGLGDVARAEGPAPPPLPGAAPDAPSRGSVGVGLGIPYGVLGINADVALMDHVSLSAGVGTTMFAGVGYSAGAKLFFLPPEKRWRPRIAAFYGTNSIVVVEGSVSIKEKFNGLTVGAGVQRTFGTRGKHGLDLDLMVIATSGGMKDELERIEMQYGMTIEEPSPVKISIGYRYLF